MNRLYITRIVTAIGLLGSAVMVASGSAAAQANPDSVLVERVTPRWTTGSVNLQLGSSTLGLGDVNAAMAANHRGSVAEQVKTIGVSAYARFGRTVFGVTGESSLPERATSPGWLSTFSIGSAMIDAGFAVFETRRVLVYPQVSLGIRKSTLHMERRGDFTFDEAVSDPARGMSLTSTAAMAGLGVAAEMHLASRRTGDFAIGLRAGIVRPLANGGTRSGESAVTGAPGEARARYFRLSMGKPIGRRRNALGALSTALLSLATR